MADTFIQRVFRNDRLRLSLIILMLMGGMMVAPGNSDRAQGATVKIMPLGDSLTVGYPQNEGGYRPTLWQKLTEAGFSVQFVGSVFDGFAWAQPLHEGHNGWTIADIHGQVANWLTVYEPDIVLLLIGTNDVLSGDPAGMIADLRELLVTMTATRPQMRLAVGTLPPINDPVYNAQVTAFNQLLPALIQEQAHAGRRVTWVDLNTPFNTGDLLDGVHLTTAGYQKLGEAWYPVAAKLLRDPYMQLTPISREHVNSIQPVFAWTQGTPDETYKIKIKAVDGSYKFVQSGIGADACVDGICRVAVNLTASPPPNHIDLKWKVSGMGTGRKTSGSLFRTDMPGPPTLLQPLQGAVVPTLTPDFVWSAVEEAESANLIVERVDQEPVTRVVDVTFSPSTVPSLAGICDPVNGICAVNLGALSLALPANGVYRWRVRTFNAYGKSRSKWWTFNVSGASTLAVPGGSLIPLPDAPPSGLSGR